MLSRKFIRLLMISVAIIFASPILAIDENSLPHLFKYTIGQKYSSSEKPLTKHEEKDNYDYSFESHNPNYMFQSVKVSKVSSTIVGITGTAFHKTRGACENQLAEVATQLKGEYPGLEDKITYEKISLAETIDQIKNQNAVSQSEIAYHLLSRERPRCFIKTTVGNEPLTYPCSISFTSYCDPMGNAYHFHIEASDTEYSEKARMEAHNLASKSRKQLE